MSALRLGRRPDGTRDIRILDDGAVGRVTHSRLGIRGGSVAGVVAMGESTRTRELRLQREAMARTRP